MTVGQLVEAIAVAGQKLQREAINAGCDLSLEEFHAIEVDIRFDRMHYGPLLEAKIETPDDAGHTLLVLIGGKKS